MVVYEFCSGLRIGVKLAALPPLHLPVFTQTLKGSF